MYQKDDYIVYKHDVCKIKDIKENRMTESTYYIMTPIDDDSLILIFQHKIEWDFYEILFLKRCRKNLLIKFEKRIILFSNLHKNIYIMNFLLR